LQFIGAYGGSTVAIRDIQFVGPSQPTEHVIPFSIISDKQMHTYTISIYETFTGFINRLQLQPVVALKTPLGSTIDAPRIGDSFRVDFIYLMKPPHVYAVQGCIDQYYSDAKGPGLQSPTASLTPDDWVINDHLQVGATQFSNDAAFEAGQLYATTYNCFAGSQIIITGTYFDEDTSVHIDEDECLNVSYLTEQQQITCTLPQRVVDSSVAQRATSIVKLCSSLIPDVCHAVDYLSYTVPPAALLQPVITNVAARSIDINWNAPTDVWQALAITGYQIGYTAATAGVNYTAVTGEIAAITIITVGNVTTTTLTDLQANTSYACWVRAISEQTTTIQWRELDLYGRRNLVNDAVIGAYSMSVLVTTLAYDIEFTAFNAAATLNAGATVVNASSVGPRGQTDGEGAYGVITVGSAHIANCNRTSTCCDDYPSCTATSISCSASDTPGMVHSIIQQQSDYTTLANSVVLPYGALGLTATAQCGPAIRLTSSHAYQAGAVWYPRKQSVDEGFVSIFTFQLSNPSYKCLTMNDVSTNCHARGSDGLAFVIQNANSLSQSLGASGNGLGYDGIHNMLAIEFDTYYNPQLLEPYENHISIHISSSSSHTGSASSSHSSHSMGSSVGISDLTIGVHTAKIVYQPEFDAEVCCTAITALTTNCYV
jgi:Bacterial lectin/Fibronectin type III domain/IPT/TIG domain